MYRITKKTAKAANLYQNPFKVCQKYTIFGKNLLILVKNRKEKSMKTSPSTERAELLRDVGVWQLLAISRSLFWNLHKRGVIPPPIRLGKAVRWRRADIERLIQDGTQR